MKLILLLPLLLSVVLLGVIGYGGYRYSVLSTEHQETTEALASSTEGYTTLAHTATELGAALEAEQRRNGTFEEKISAIASTVGMLDKLANTDKELLAKYSKVYFLSEHYIPTRLADIQSEFRYPADKELSVHAQIAPFLEELMQEAAKDGIDIKVLSAYRSFGAQGSLKNSYKVTYGKGANTFSADQGYSEHQLGTTIDFTTEKSAGSLAGFDSTEAYTWLTRNAYRYGFVLSYPKGNAYYQYEPWHWRFVGTRLANRLEQDDEYFYELEQRDIDTYLVTLFD